MKQLISIAILGASYLSCGGCTPSVIPITAQPSTEEIEASIEYLMEEPQPLPAFVRTIEPTPGNTVAPSDTIFVMIYQGALWEFGNLANYLQTHIIKDTVISIDYEQIPAQAYDAVFGPGLDANGKPTDRFFSPVQFEFTPDMISDIEEGPHLATIRTTSMSGVAHEYSWVFIVDD